MKFSIEDLFRKCDQIRMQLRIWPHLLKKSLMENFIFCAVYLKLMNYTFLFCLLWNYFYQTYSCKNKIEICFFNILLEASLSVLHAKYTGSTNVFCLFFAPLQGFRRTHNLTTKYLQRTSKACDNHMFVFFKWKILFDQSDSRTGWSLISLDRFKGCFQIFCA